MARVASKDPNVEVQLTSEMLNQPLLDIPNPIPKSFSYSHFGFDAETFAVDGTNPLPRPPGSYKDSQGNSFARRMSTSASREFDTGISRQSFKKSLDDMFFPPKGANPSVKKQSADSLHLVEENSTRSATVSKLVAGGSETPDSGASRSRSNSVVLTPAGSPRSSPKPPANNKKKLSKSESRELQEKQRAEKAARNAAMGVVPKSAKSKQDESKTKANTRAGNKNVAVAENQASRQNVPKRRPKQPEDHGIASALKQSTLLSHLPIWEKYSADPKQFGLVHPAVMTLARHFAELTITGSNARCLAMLLTFKKVITDYVTPPSLTLQRDLLQHLSRQVDFINRSRSLATSMRTAVRFLKTVISQSPIETPDSDVFLH